MAGRREPQGLTGTPQQSTVQGGTFTPWTESSGEATEISGVFTGGSVAQTGGFSGCVNETYAVQGVLAIGSPSQGGGNFNAILTHYRKLVRFLGCVTYAATVVGEVTLTLADPL